MKKYNRGKNNRIVRKAWNGEEGVKTIRALDRFDAKAVPIAAMSANAFEHVTEEGNR